MRLPDRLDEDDAIFTALELFGSHICPRCGSKDTDALGSLDGWAWRCHDCRKVFSFWREDSPLKFSKLTPEVWLAAAYLWSPEGGSWSINKVWPELGINYRTAWRMWHVLYRRDGMENFPKLREAAVKLFQNANPSRGVQPHG